VSPEATITHFYEAFSRRDGETMAACYAPDAHFSDPMFSDLKGPEIGAMWQMLTSAGRDLEVRLLEHSADADTGSARWVADYSFSRTGRQVHNDVRATFRFNAAGLIADHRETFDIHAWAKQALGPVGWLLGWAPPFQKVLGTGARSTLSKYMQAATATGGTTGP
jgi:ketosteroid isomerase-like protein